MLCLSLRYLRFLLFWSLLFNYLTILVIRFVFLIESVVSFMNCFLSLLQLYFFSHCLYCLLAIIIETIQPSISESPFVFNKKSFLIDLPNFLLFFHVEWLHLIPKIFYLFFDIMCYCFFAMIFDGFLKVFVKVLILCLLLLVNTCFFLMFSHKPCLLCTSAWFLFHLILA